jgi:hypothetical protein
VANWYVNSNTAADWTATTAITLGARRVAPVTQANAQRKFQVYECTTAGTTGGTEPTWNTTVGGTVVDGTVTWTTRNASTWANAHRYVNHLLMMNIALVAGDTIYVKNTHVETRTTSEPNFPITLGTRDTPTRIVCVSDSAEPPTTLATGAVVATGGVHSINGYLYYYGIELKSGDGVATTQGIVLGGSASVSRLVFERCRFNMASTGGASILAIGETSTGLIFSVDFINCTFTFGAAGASIRLDGGQMTFLGGSVTGTAPTTLFNQGTANANRVLMVEGMDLSLVSGTVFSMTAQTGDGSTIIFRCCKMNAAATMWGGTPSSASGIFRAINCSSSSANYKYSEKGYYGTIDDSAAVYLTGGATDGTTPTSRLMVSTANSKRTQPLYGPWISHWQDTTGAVTVTVETFVDAAALLKDNEVWLEVMYPSDASFPLSALATDASDVLAAGANQPASSATWVHAATNPKPQQLQVACTVAMKGVLMGRVCLAKASQSLYYDHRLVVT